MHKIGKVYFCACSEGDFHVKYIFLFLQFELSVSTMKSLYHHYDSLPSGNIPIHTTWVEMSFILGEMDIQIYLVCQEY